MTMGYNNGGTFDCFAKTADCRIAGSGTDDRRMGESDAECDDSRTVLTVEVQLKPDSEYRLWLNRNANKNFASSDGGVLPDTEYVFYTGPAR